MKISNVSKKGANYTATLKNPNGVVLGTSETKAADEKTAADFSDFDFAVTFKANPLSTDKNVASSDFLVGGTYTVELSDGSTVISTKEVKVVKLTQVAADESKTETVSYFTEGTDFKASFIGTMLDAEGFRVEDTKGLKGDVTLTQTLETATIDGDTYANNSVTFTITNCAEATGTTYALSIKDPSGAEIWSEEGKSLGAAVTVTFDQKASGNRAYNNATVAAGDYVATITKTVKETGKADVVTTAKGKLTITEVKYDAGQGSFTDKDFVTDVFYSGTETPADVEATVTAPEGYTTDKAWQLNGKALSAENAIKAGQVNTLTATYTAIDKSMYVANPTVASVTKDAKTGKLTVTLACATAGANIVINGSTAYDTAKGVEIAVGDTFTAQAVTVKGLTDPKLTENSDVITVATATADFDNLVKGANSKLELFIGKTKTKWMAQADIAAAIAAGQSSIDTTLAAEQSEWTKLIVSADKAVYDAVAAYANAELAKYADGAAAVVDGKAYVIASTTLKTATDAVAKAVKDLGNIKTPTAANYKTAVDDIVNATNTALNAATESKTVTAADIEGAAAVDAAIAALPTEVTADNYEAAAKAAAEAQAAYDALSAEGKKLVTGDIQIITKTAAAAKAEEEAKKAAEEAEKAAAEAAAALVASQDKAAVNLVNNPKTKTVKLATAKKAKTTLTYKVKVSASGSLVTYAKVSGNAKITVGAAGKVTLKKVTKAGTYKAKVLVTCGAQTRTVTVKFVVTK